MNKINDNNKLAIQMLIAMVSGILVGLLCGLPYVGAPVRGLAFLFMMGYAIRSLRVGMLQRREERNQEDVQF
jgi:hypothetical protein